MQWTNNAGPRRIKPVTELIKAIRWESQTYDELYISLVNGLETRSTFTQLFGGCRSEVIALLKAVGEKYAWTVTVANIKSVVADLQAALETAKSQRPVLDKRDEYRAKWERSQAGKAVAVAV